MTNAKDFIPSELWPATPVVLKATAGLRLLPPAKADNILNTARETLKKSVFLMVDNAVEIMDGTDEGILSWFTVNFLLNRLGGHNTVAALDLGGGSTQVTFVPNDPSQTPRFADYMHTVPSGSSSFDVFTNSYLNLGLMAGRHAIYTHKLPSNQTDLLSDCVNPIVQNKLWQYGNVDYMVR